MYKTLNESYRERYGCKVYKLSLDGGFTCPNRDGTLGTRGCIFCSGDGSGTFAAHGTSIAEQLEQAKARVQAKTHNGKYIAYFQSFTGTYAPLPYLEKVYTEALRPQEIVALSVATRPDCLSDEVIDLLARLNKEKDVSVELGLQTVHPASVAYIRRGYENEVYFDAMRRLKQAGLETVTHVILGLPNETTEMVVQTTRAAIDAGTDGVKFHLLHVLRGTDLERDYLAGKFSCLSMEQYGQMLRACIDILPPHVVVHRITGDGAKRDLIAPLWSADKKRVLNYLQSILR